jgi:nucleolar protein 9
MPRDNKKRGRREEKKRKREEENPNHEQLPSKRQKSEDLAQDSDQELFQVDVTGDTRDILGDEKVNQEPITGQADIDTPFYGLLTEEEQTYYANVSNKLDVNDFESEEDRKLFIVAVHRETIGKELKVASSQSSSRYLEKVIAVSEGRQLRNLIGRFLGNLIHLVQHRFASHVCETLFLRSSAFLDDETQSEMADEEDEKRSMAELFVLVSVELQPNLGFLLTDRFGSHVVRVLLLILSGEPLDADSAKGMLAKGKRAFMHGGDSEELVHTSGSRAVPASFKPALTRMMASSISGLDTTNLRALATHPTGNPVLQLLLRLELTLYGKSKAKDDTSLLRRLLPEDAIEEGSESAKFLQGLIYDPTGSRLVETMVQYAPGKTFKHIYGDLLKIRLGSMARNDIASYVACKILERLSKDDLEAARDLILPELPALIERYRTGLIKVLIERCTAREADVGPLAEALRKSYGEDPTARLLKILKLDAGLEEPKVKKIAKEGQQGQVNAARAVDLHGSLLAQTMLLAPSPISNLIYDPLLTLPSDLLLLLAKDSTASRIIQTAVTSPTSTPQYRRKLIPMFYGHMVELATDQAGSHLADALWDGTNDAHFIKEKLAKELADQEGVLRDSRYGRSVWKNWSMDLFSRRPQEWQNQAKGHRDILANKDVPNTKSAIQLAREKYAQKRARGPKLGAANATISNPRGRLPALSART